MVSSLPDESVAPELGRGTGRQRASIPILSDKSADLSRSREPTECFADSCSRSVSGLPTHHHHHVNHRAHVPGRGRAQHQEEPLSSGPRRRLRLHQIRRRASVSRALLALFALLSLSYVLYPWACTNRSIQLRPTKQTPLYHIHMMSRFSRPGLSRGPRLVSR